MLHGSSWSSKSKIRMQRIGFKRTASSRSLAKSFLYSRRSAALLVACQIVYSSARISASEDYVRRAATATGGANLRVRRRAAACDHPPPQYFFPTAPAICFPNSLPSPSRPFRLRSRSLPFLVQVLSRSPRFPPEAQSVPTLSHFFRRSPEMVRLPPFTSPLHLFLRCGESHLPRHFDPGQLVWSIW